MKGFTPGLLDRLMDERLLDERRDAASRTLPAAMGVEQYKDSVARDLEALLNTRVAVDVTHLEGFPEAGASILHYGLIDFAGLCLTSSADRAAVCASIEDAIATHEPRLLDARAVLEPDAGDVNRLHFAIHARLALAPGNGAELTETVNFNAVLQPSSLHYEIKRSARSSRG
jgi:type VI secretion system protein ImpF